MKFSQRDPWLRSITDAVVVDIVSINLNWPGHIIKEIDNPNAKPWFLLDAKPVNRGSNYTNFHQIEMGFIITDLDEYFWTKANAESLSDSQYMLSYVDKLALKEAIERFIKNNI